MMAPAPLVVASTMAGATTLGRTWRHRMTRSAQPIPCAASTYGRARTPSTAARTMRVNCGTPAIPTAIITLARLPPRMATTASAKRIPGNASKRSMARMITKSAARP